MADGTLKVGTITTSSGSGTITLGQSGETLNVGTGVVSKLGKFESQLLHVRDEKGQGVAGGTNIGGVNIRDLNTIKTNEITVNIRDLNTIKTNEITGASVSSNQITLPAGTYYIDGSAPTYRTGYSHVYLYNVTDSANELYGYNDYANLTDGAGRSHVVGRFTISSQKVFELRHYAHTVFATYGLGLFMNYNSLPSIYAEVLIWRTGE